MFSRRCLKRRGGEELPLSSLLTKSTWSFYWASVSSAAKWVHIIGPIEYCWGANSLPGVGLLPSYLLLFLPCKCLGGGWEGSTSLVQSRIPQPPTALAWSTLVCVTRSSCICCPSAGTLLGHMMSSKCFRGVWPPSSCGLEPAGMVTDWNFIDLVFPLESQTPIEIMEASTKSSAVN